MQPYRSPFLHGLRRRSCSIEPEVSASVALYRPSSPLRYLVGHHLLACEGLDTQSGGCSASALSYPFLEGQASYAGHVRISASRLTQVVPLRLVRVTPDVRCLGVSGVSATAGQSFTAVPCLPLSPALRAIRPAIFHMHCSLRVMPMHILVKP